MRSKKAKVKCARRDRISMRRLTWSTLACLGAGCRWCLGDQYLYLYCYSLHRHPYTCTSMTRRRRSYVDFLSSLWLILSIFLRSLRFHQFLIQLLSNINFVENSRLDHRPQRYQQYSFHHPSYIPSVLSSISHLFPLQTKKGSTYEVPPTPNFGFEVLPSVRSGLCHFHQLATNEKRVDKSTHSHPRSRL